MHTREELANTISGSQGASDAALRQTIIREHSPRTSGRRNFTAGVREREDANRTREAGDSVWENRGFPRFSFFPPLQTRRREELANTISHCLGLIAAVVAGPILLIAAWRSDDAGFFAGTLVFVATMVALYSVSMLYHAWPPTRAKQTLQMLDHCAIFLLIAGTYTPLALGPLRGILGSTILGSIWPLAIFGVVLKATRGPERHRGFGLFLYLAMGWSVLVLIRPLISHLPPGALFWLIAGGVAYTTGVLFFINERMRYAHFVWHLFVLTGTGSHFVALLYCVPVSGNTVAGP